jgi:hypothetical protein
MNSEIDITTMGGSLGQLPQDIEIPVLGENLLMGASGTAEIARLMGYKANVSGKKVLASVGEEENWFEFPSMVSKQCPERDQAIEDLGLEIFYLPQDGKHVGICMWGSNCFVVGPCDRTWHVDAKALYSALLLKAHE